MYGLFLLLVVVTYRFMSKCFGLVAGEIAPSCLDCTDFFFAIKCVSIDSAFFAAVPSIRSSRVKIL